jgi:hypothetical protein
METLYHEVETEFLNTVYKKFVHNSFLVYENVHPTRVAPSLPVILYKEFSIEAKRDKCG